MVTTNLFLTDPFPLYRESFLAGLAEDQAEGRKLDLNLEEITTDFEGYIRQILQKRNLAYVPPGRVPETTLWLIANTEFAGRISIRPELNAQLLQLGGNIGYEVRPALRQRGYGKEILRLGLNKARALGLIRALLTCNVNNTASQKIIEYNGGVFENEVEVKAEEGWVKIRRFWIEL